MWGRDGEVSSALLGLGDCGMLKENNVVIHLNNWLTRDFRK